LICYLGTFSDVSPSYADFDKKIVSILPAAANNKFYLEIFTISVVELEPIGQSRNEPRQFVGAGTFTRCVSSNVSNVFGSKLNFSNCYKLHFSQSSHPHLQPCHSSEKIASNSSTSIFKKVDNFILGSAPELEPHKNDVIPQQCSLCSIHDR
jgi:hypothetical protein